MVSPFTPYLGKAPKAFIGRNKEINTFRRSLEDAQNNKPGSILLIGDRGLGKTVLLKYFVGIARETNFHPIYLGIDESSNKVTTLARRIYGRIKAVMEDEFVGLKAKRFVKKIEPKVSLTIKDLEIQLSSSLNEEEVNENNFILALGKLIKGRKICLFTDETQSGLGKGVARFLVNSFYAELPDYASNWIVVLAGTPVLEHKILEATPADRAFLRMILKNMDDTQVKDVLQKTTKETEINFSDKACKLISEDTQGMPYYIQFFGDRLFDISKGRNISEKFYLNNREKVIDTLGEMVFDTRLNELSRRGLYYEILKKFALLDTEEGVNLNEATNEFSTYGGPYVQELETKGYIARIKRGRYRVSDKLFRDWICKQNK